MLGVSSACCSIYTRTEVRSITHAGHTVHKSLQRQQLQSSGLHGYPHAPVHIYMCTHRNTYKLNLKKKKKPQMRSGTLPTTRHIWDIWDEEGYSQKEQKKGDRPQSKVDYKSWLKH